MAVVSLLFVNLGGFAKALILQLTMAKARDMEDTATGITACCGLSCRSRWTRLHLVTPVLQKPARLATTAVSPLSRSGSMLTPMKSWWDPNWHERDGLKQKQSRQFLIFALRGKGLAESQIQRHRNMPMFCPWSLRTFRLPL